MPTGRDDKQASTEKGADKAAGSKAKGSSKSRAKKEGTRISTMVDMRSADKKAGGAGSRDKPRDGSR